MSDSKNISARIQAQMDTPQVFLKNYGLSNNDTLFVFVGQKISITPLPSKHRSMDYCFKAKYLILERIFGDFKGDTIEFAVFDHYGQPRFSFFTNVLLFVSAEKGTYFHQKYLFNDVYKTKDGRWAGAYSTKDYEHKYNKKTTIKPIRIDFAKEVSYPTEIERDGNKIELSYPEPFYKIKGRKAIVVYGNYVEELYKLKRDGFLRARSELNAP